MSGAIVLTGLSANDPVPGTYLEVNFAQGEAAGDSSPREALLMGNKTSAGSATVDTVVYGPDSQVPMQTEDDVIGLFGAGSELHRMWRRFVAVNKDTTVRAIAVTESAGTAASGTIIFSTTAAAGGYIRTWVGDEFVDTSVSSGDTAGAIATAVTASVNTMTHWPVTAAVVSTTHVTLTAKQKGPRGNWIRFQSLVFGRGVATTSNATADAYFTSGATADSNAAALATIAVAKYYYIVSAAEDATQFGALVAQVNSMAAPTTGMRQRAFAGSVDSLANTITIAIGINAARAEIAWLERSTMTPAELAANEAAIAAEFETSPNPRTNFIGFGNDSKTQAFWRVKAPRDTSVMPSRTSIKSALNNGISPIGVLPTGATYLVNRITTRSLNGSVNDYRIRASHKVTICDFFGDDLVAKIQLQHAGKRIGDDPVRGARAPGPDVVTPTIMRGTVFGLINQYDSNDLLQDVQTIKDRTIVQRENTPRTRMSIRIPLAPIDNLEQSAIALDQVA